MARTLAGRPFEPDEIGPIVAFLASDLSNPVQGQVIAVDGGIAGLG